MYSNQVVHVLTEDDVDMSDAEHLEDVIGKQKHEPSKSQYETRKEKVGSFPTSVRFLCSIFASSRSIMEANFWEKSGLFTLVFGLGPVHLDSRAL